TTSIELVANLAELANTYATGGRRACSRSPLRRLRRHLRTARAVEVRHRRHPRPAAAHHRHQGRPPVRQFRRGGPARRTGSPARPVRRPRPPSGSSGPCTATAPLRPRGRRQLVSTSSELIVSHSALNHRWDCSTNVVSRGPAPCAKENSIDRMPWASYICRLSWSMRVSWRDRV